MATQRPITDRSAHQDVYQLVTDRLIEALEGGVIPWRKPWNAEYGQPRNYATGRAYTGINAFLLHVASTGETPFFLTYKQAQALGGHVRKGAKGLPVIYYNTLVKRTPEGPSQDERRIPFIRMYWVFNVADVEGVEIKLPEAAPAPQAAPTPLTAGEAVVKGWAGRPLITYGGSEAFYHPALDYVRVPTLGRFRSAEGYYATLFHELVHSTGHAKRLNRPDLAEALQASSTAYAREELTAEMGAAFLCAQAGLDPTATLTNAAAYIKGWLHRLRDDKKLVIQAASRAQRAAELILGTTPEQGPIGVGEGPGGDDTPPPAAPAGAAQPVPASEGPDSAPASVPVEPLQMEPAPVGPWPAGRPAHGPLLRQWEQLKAQHPDALLLFRVGDSYQAFGTDAVALADVLTLPLVASGGPALYELTGFLAVELDLFLPRLTRAGYRVAVCDQLESPLRPE